MIKLSLKIFSIRLKTRQNLVSHLLTVHALVLSFVQYFGSAILVLAGAAALMGHLEKAIWSNKKYGEKNAEGVLVNIIGILIILFISGVTFLVTRFSKEDPKTSVH